MTDVREELRLAEERVSQLREENARLSQRILRHAGLRNAIVAGVLVALLGGASGFIMMDRVGEARAARETALVIREHALRLESLRGATDECRLSAKKTAYDLAQCTDARARRPPPSREEPPRLPRCNCEAGDPLCPCL